MERSVELIEQATGFRIQFQSDVIFLDKDAGWTKNLANTLVDILINQTTRVHKNAYRQGVSDGERRRGSAL